jgi:hypothetical protein
VLAGFARTARVAAESSRNKTARAVKLGRHAVYRSDERALTATDHSHSHGAS